MRCGVLYSLPECLVCLVSLARPSRYAQREGLASAETNMYPAYSTDKISCGNVTPTSNHRTSLAEPDYHRTLCTYQWVLLRPGMGRDRDGTSRPVPSRPVTKIRDETANAYTDIGR